MVPNYVDAMPNYVDGGSDFFSQRHIPNFLLSMIHLIIRIPALSYLEWKAKKARNDDKPPDDEPEGESATGSISYFGIVDILTPYKLRKRCETLCCGTLMGCRDISCQPPDAYQERFNRFMDKEVLAVTAGPAVDAGDRM